MTDDRRSQREAEKTVSHKQGPYAKRVKKDQTGHNAIVCRWRCAVASWIAIGLVAACSPEDRTARRQASGDDRDVAARLRQASATNGARLFGRCAACHAIGQGAPDRNGPTLFGIMGSRVAHVRPRFAYTAALQQAGGRWTPERMDAWLAAPQRYAPGTSMRFSGLADPLDRADVIAYLQSRH